MEAVAKVNYHQKPLLLSLHHRSSLSNPISSLSFKTPPPSPFLKSPFSSSIRASTSSSPFSDHPIQNPKTPKAQPFQPKNPFPLSLLRTTFIAAIAASALFFSRFKLKPIFAAPISPPPTADEAISSEDEERNLEERLISNPDDIEALKNLMEIKIKSRKIQEAVNILEQLIIREPNDVEWPLLKAHMHCYGGELELAKLGFNEILSKDPFRVEAYHGLVMVASQSDSDSDLKEIEKRIQEAIGLCKREKKREDLRDFKLLLAQIRVIEGNYNEALKVYQELVKEEPRDFRPYLCQGIIYTLLRKKDEAEKQFQKYRRLVPKGHPYARYFDDNMIATKVMGQKFENERAASRR